jgi:hypothetical protein
MNAGARVFGGQWDEEAKAYTRWAIKGYERAFRKLQVAVGKEIPTVVRGRMFHAEHSWMVRFCAFLLAYPKGAKVLTLAEAQDLAKTVNLRKPSKEPVRAWAHAKPDGGDRPLVSFGPVDRAARRLTDDILHSVWGISPYEYACKGRGRDAATRSWLSTHKKGKAKRHVRADISNFYGSVNHDELVKMIPLPESITRNSILIPTTKHIIISNRTLTSEETVRSGLPQGSRPSARVAGKIIQSMVEDLPSAIAVISHGDDILVAARNDDEAEAVKSALVSRVAKHPVGPFKLKIAEVIGPGRPNDFLGYMIRHQSAAYGGGAKVTPSHKAITRFQRRTASALVLLPNATRCDAIEARCDAWAASFGAWQGRAGGSSIAVVAMYEESVSAMNAFRWYVSNRKRTFKSFRDIQTFFDSCFRPYVGGSASETCIVSRVLFEMRVRSGLARLTQS